MIPAKEFEGELWIKASDHHRAIKTAQRPWVGLTDEQFTEAARLAEAGNYLVAFQRIQQWLKEGNI